MRSAAEVLQAQASKNVALGFKPPNATANGDEESNRIERILREHGASLDAGQFKRLMEYLRAQQEHQAARNHFFAQAAVSACIVAFAVLLLGPAQE